MTDVSTAPAEVPADTAASASADSASADSASADSAQTPTPPSRSAWGHGLATVTMDGVVLDTWYPTPQLGAAPEDAGPHAVPPDLASLESLDPHRQVRQQVVRTVIDLDLPPADASDAYLRLHLLSHRLVAPHGLNLDGIFGVLANVVWTNHGPCAVDDFEQTRLRLRASGQQGGRVEVFGIDKFPRMTDYVVPSGVRIANADRIRLGAHLAPGTTVMHEGFVNFNAGTLGVSMIEGRVSAGVVVGNGSDVGGGASIMGTLSGGGKNVTSIGERCLLGANAGIGISLGDDCVVEAGLYVTAGTKVLLLGDLSTAGRPGAAAAGSSTDPDGERRVVKAAELSGASGILFRRNAQSGAVEAHPRAGKKVELNAALHAND